MGIAPYKFGRRDAALLVGLITNGEQDTAGRHTARMDDQVKRASWMTEQYLT